MEKPKLPRCVACEKPIKPDEQSIANDEGRKWHYRCVMRSQEYHDEFGT